MHILCAFFILTIASYSMQEEEKTNLYLIHLSDLTFPCSRDKMMYLIKHTNISTINFHSSTTHTQRIQEHGMALRLPNTNSAALLEILEYIYQKPSLRSHYKISRQARKAVYEKFK